MVRIASLWIATCAGLPAMAFQSGESDVLVLRVAEPRSWIDDPKDAGLAAALGMLGARLAELPDELGGAVEIPPHALALAGWLFESSFDLRVGVVEDEGAEFPFYAQLALHAGSAEEATTAADRLARALEAFGAGAGPPDERGMRALPAPVPAWFGPRGSDVVVALGRTVDAPLDLSSTHLPAGAEPDLALRVDLARILQLAADFGGGDPSTAQVLGVFELLGLDEARFAWSLGSDAERGYAVTSVIGAAPGMLESGILPPRPIPKRCIAAVPADATWAVVGTGDLSRILELVRGLEGGGPSARMDPLAALAEATGIDLEREFLDHLGWTNGAYASDTTGGGGLLSTVLFLELGDPDGLAHSLESHALALNALGRDEADGYVQVRERRIAGRRVWTLEFPGLPVPIEPSLTIAAGFLFAGMGPQAVVAAAQHAESGTRGLAGHAPLLEQLPEGLDGLYGLSYLDTPRLLRDGYGWASLGASALANAVRSRSDAARDPGPILPPYPELAAGAKAWVTATRVIGEDVVEISRMDRSFLVNATAVVGFASSLPIVFGLPALLAAGTRTAAVSEAVLEQHGQAVEQKIEADLLALHYAAVEYALFHDGRYPASLEDLTRPDDSGHATLQGGLPSDPWGRAYVYRPAADPEETPRIATLGRDGRPGGEGPDADVDNHGVLRAIERRNR